MSNLAVDTPPQVEERLYRWLYNVFLRIKTGIAFSVNKNSTNQSISNNSETKLTWSTIVFDTAGGFSTTNNRYTVIYGGKYQITAQAKLNASLTTGEVFELALYKNGSEIYRTSRQFNEQPVCLLTCLVDLEKNDYIEIYTRHTEGASQNVLGTTTLTFFQGHRIG